MTRESVFQGNKWWNLSITQPNKHIDKWTKLSYLTKANFFPFLHELPCHTIQTHIEQKDCARGYFHVLGIFGFLKSIKWPRQRRPIIPIQRKQWTFQLHYTNLFKKKKELLFKTRGTYQEKPTYPLTQMTNTTKPIAQNIYIPGGG